MHPVPCPVSSALCQSAVCRVFVQQQNGPRIARGPFAIHKLLTSLAACLGQRLIQIGDQVVRILQPDVHPHQLKSGPADLLRLSS